MSLISVPNFMKITLAWLLGQRNTLILCFGARMCLLIDSKTRYFDPKVEVGKLHKIYMQEVLKCKLPIIVVVNKRCMVSRKHGVKNSLSAVYDVPLPTGHVISRTYQTIVRQVQPNQVISLKHTVQSISEITTDQC